VSGRRLLFLVVQAPLALLLTAAFAAGACLAALVDRSGRSTREVGGAWSRTLLRLFGVAVSVTGAENVPEGPAVYAANHTSALDILVLFGWLPVDFRIVYKRSLSLVPLVGWSIWLSGHIPIDRSHPFRARRSLAAAARRIRSGTSVVLFPEGTRSPDGTVRLFKRGSFSLAIEAGVPVVPVSLAGVKAVVPSGMASLRPGHVWVAIARPVPASDRTLAEVDAFADEVRQVVIANCAALQGGARPA
jgi:1-acyl-sn-glycerol-3-phosphate acyltransferase